MTEAAADGLTWALLLGAAASALRLATPLMLGALGGYASERGGVVNIALEGFMLIGAFAAAAGAYAFHNPWIGVLWGMAAAMGLAALHAFLCVNLGADHIISGVAINFLAAGLPPVMAKAFYGYSGGTPQLDAAICMPETSLGSPLFWAALVLAVLMSFVHLRHRFGQYLRFAGEHPEALQSQGVSVKLVRWEGVLLAGAFCGLAGAYLSIDHGTAFSRNMTAGRGFIALAALIVGRHTPYGAVAAALGFGAVESAQILLQGSGLPLPVQWLQMIPYGATLVILAFGLKRR